MAKLKIERESKEEKFKRIVSLRTQRILNDFRLLANCSDKRVYSYNEKDTSKIFSTIEEELERVKSLFSSPKKFFKL